MISDHLKPRPVQRNKIFQQKKKVVKRTSLFMQCSKVRAEIAATAERNGRKCRHVYVVINPDLQAQDQPKGKQKKRKKWSFIQSAIVFFFSFPCVTIIAIRIAAAADARQTYFSSAPFQCPTRTLFQLNVPQNTRDDDVCPPLNRRETHRDDRHISLNTSRFCLFVFVSSSSSFEK